MDVHGPKPHQGGSLALNLCYSGQTVVGGLCKNLRLHCLQTSNILLNKDHTRAKVADVGLSRVLQNTLSLSMASCPMGTFAYCGECSSRQFSCSWWCWAAHPWSALVLHNARPGIS